MIILGRREQSGIEIEEEEEEEEEEEDWLGKEESGSHDHHSFEEAFAPRNRVRGLFPPRPTRSDARVAAALAAFTSLSLVNHAAAGSYSLNFGKNRGLRRFVRGTGANFRICTATYQSRTYVVVAQ